MTTTHPFLTARLGIAALIALVAGCAPAGEPVTGPSAQPAIQPLPPGEVRWTVATRPSLDLWYHGLASIDFRGTAATLPIHPVDYATRMRAAKQAAGVHPTALDRRAEEFRSLFEAGPRYSALHFMPLHFPSGEHFFTAMRAWVQVGGDPRRVADQNLAQAVGFISQQFPTEGERRALAGWMEVLTEEGRVFYTAHREQQSGQLAAIVTGAQSEWDRLVPRLRPVLDYLHLNQGELLVSPPIGIEGRTLDLGRRFNRVAVLMPEPTRSGDVVWAALHELMYPFVNGVLQDQLSPAQLRDADQPLLARRAAIRAGALVLAQVAPEALQPYREAHLRWAGVAVPVSAAEREAALARAYPLPESLPPALSQGIETMLRGF
jgi:hypothetical protein